MNKSEFIRAYADTLGVTIKEAEGNFNAFVETLTEKSPSDIFEIAMPKRLIGFSSHIERP